MKKKTTMFIALASVMLGVGYGAISQKNDSKNTDSILLENVEALASKLSGTRWGALARKIPSM